MMDRTLLRAYVLELLGVFGLVFFGAGLVLVQQLTTPEQQNAGTAPLLGHQPGLVGIALGQGLIFAVLLALTLPVSGGGLNPALTLALWVLGQLEGRRVYWLVGAQLAGATLAAMVLRFNFAEPFLREARMGAPHLNPLTYREFTPSTLGSGLTVELVLTFFLAFAIFQTIADRSVDRRDARWTGLAGGLTLTTCVLFGYPLTGAALNPARWFGPVLIEWWQMPPRTPGPWADALVYVGGPLLGAGLAGLVCLVLLRPENGPLSPTPSAPPPSKGKGKK